MRSRRHLSAVCLALLIVLSNHATAVADDPSNDEMNVKVKGSGNAVQIQGHKNASHHNSSAQVLDPTGEIRITEGGGSVVVQRVVAQGFCDHLYRGVVMNHPCWRRYLASEEEPPAGEGVILLTCCIRRLL